VVILQGVTRDRANLLVLLLNFGDACALYAEGRKSEALDLLYETVDSVLLMGGTGEVDQFLSMCQVTGTPPSILIGLLTITQPFRDSLPARPLLEQRIKLAMRGVPDADRALHGLVA
jgi:hypothetical protein